jgi:TonB family protein
LPPTTPWEVNYAENSCRLNREFGTGDNKVVLGFESEVPGTTDMVALGKPMTTRTERIPVRFLPARGEPQDGRPADSPKGPVVLWSKVSLLPDDVAERLKQEEKARGAKRGVRPPPLDLAREAQTRAAHQLFAAQTYAIEIAARRERPVILETGPMGDAVKAFDKCSRDSLRDWGIDPDVEDRIVRPPWPIGVRNWFSSNDYPPAMRRTGDEADIKLRLLVDAAGNPTRCTVVSRFKEKSFDKVVCDVVMRRARFAPAELADGTRVPSYYYNHIVFRME